jgi:hypothetical protein
MNNYLDCNTIGINFKQYNGDSEAFSGTDSKELYLKNLNKYGLDWHYSSTSVYYNRNNLGYRSRSLDEINKERFFLALGCSHTEGIGLSLNETWPERVSKNLNIDYLNHAKGGGGADLNYINSLMFLKNSQTLPKFVIIQWPDPSRILYKNLGDLILCGVNFPVPDYAASYHHEYIKNNSHLFNSYLSYISTQLLWKLAGVPVINWELSDSYGKYLNLELDMMFIPNDVEKMSLNRARDISHYGPIFYERVSNNIIELVTARLPAFLFTNN